MQFHLTTSAAILAAVGFLSACGGGTSNTDPTITEPIQSLVKYSGQVTDPSGKALTSISVRLENRTTDQTHETLTSADGNFSVSVQPGVYDIIFDDKDATEFTSMQLLAVDLRTDVNSKFQLQTAKSLPENQLTGTVMDTTGAPAAGRTLLILPTIARAPESAGSAEVPDPFYVNTDSLGKFSHTLGRAGMDFEFDVLVLRRNAPELDIGPLAAAYDFASDAELNAYLQRVQDYLASHVEESVDIEKPNGPMHLQLVIGSSVRNLRASAGLSSVVPADAQQLAEQHNVASAGANKSLRSTWAAVKDLTISAILGIIPPAQAGILYTKFNLNVVSPIKSGKFTDGKMMVSSPCKHFTFNIIHNGLNASDKFYDTNFLENTKFCVTRTMGFSSFVYDYENRLLTNRSGTYKFTDESNDTYSLRVFIAKPKMPGEEHIVRYNSKKPNILAIEYQLD